MKINKIVGKRIKELRINNGITRYDLSQLTSISYTYLMNIENGKANPTINILKTISVFLNIDIKEFFINVWKGD